jgi:curved DNA-binding protein
MSYKDYYSILGVARSASPDEIQKAYRKLAKKYHPDINKQPGAEERFKELGDAYSVLKDEKKRALYDQYGEAWKAVSDGHSPPPGSDRVRVDFQGAGFDPGQFNDLNSIFENIFGGGFGNGFGGGFGGGGFGGFGTSGRGERRPGFRRDVPSAGGDLEATLALTLEEAFQGGERELHLSDAATGNQKHFRVNIPKGIRPKQRIRLAGQGGKGGFGGQDGDLYLSVDIQPHAVFNLDGGNLSSIVPVSPWEATLGAEVEIETLDGPVRVKVPSGSSAGRKIRLKGKGYFNPDKTRGDLYIELQIEVPKKLTDEERDLMAKLAEVSLFNPRTKK